MPILRVALTRVGSVEEEIMEIEIQGEPVISRKSDIGKNFLKIKPKEKFMYLSNNRQSKSFGVKGEKVMDFDVGGFL